MNDDNDGDYELVDDEADYEAQVKAVKEVTGLLNRPDPGRALEAALGYLDEWPGHPNLLYCRAVALSLLGRNDEAVFIFNETLEIADAEENGQLLAEALKSQGALFRKMNRNFEALVNFRMVIELGPDVADADTVAASLMHAGELCQLAGDMAEAEAHFRRLVSHYSAPDSAPERLAGAYVSLGSLLAQEARQEEALALLESGRRNLAGRLNPETARLFGNVIESVRNFRVYKDSSAAGSDE